MNGWAWLGVAVLGAVGSIARFLLDGHVSSRARGSFPSGTFVVNMSGSLLLGLLSGAAVHGDALVLAGTATLGSYTTFSTWVLESHRLAEEGELRGAGANLAVSLLVGLASVALGHAIGATL
jgi:CrcB protein